MRNYELMVILDPNLDERTVAPSLDAFLRVVTGEGGTVEKVDVWGKRRMAFEIAKHAEGIYAVLDVTCEPATVAELDRQLTLNESVLRTKVMRREVNRRRAAAVAKVSASKAAASVAAASNASTAPSGSSGSSGSSGPRPGASAPASVPSPSSAPASAPTPAATPASAPEQSAAPVPPAPVN